MGQEVPEEVRRLEEAIEALAAMDDDAACATAVTLVLTSWPDFHKRLREIRQQRVRDLKASGLTWRQIGALMPKPSGEGGVSAARAQQISAGMRGNTDDRGVAPE